MGEDKLTRAERIRLEAFAQACNSVYCSPLFLDWPRPFGANMETFPLLLARAKRIEAWLKAAVG